ncbi:MAG: DUF5050 domain-containing protein [Lachnospiraceae bacterium]|nr:DUF5050 domain-containing protein [Lachnospiraceae bacterium]
MKKTSTIIVICAAVLILAGFVTFILLRSKGIAQNPEETVGNTAGNLNNGGYFCETDDAIYFANGYDEGTLYRMNPDLTNITKLSGASVAFLNNGGNYLYYYQKNSSAASSLGFVVRVSGLYRSDLKGAHVVCLDKSDCEQVCLVGNRVFYSKAVDGQDTMCLHSVSTSNRDKKMLTDFQVNPACALNSVIYYNGTKNDHYLYAYDTRSDTSSLVAQYDMWYPVYYGDSVYFLYLSDNYSLCRLNLSSGELTKLSPGRVDCFNIANGYVYYQTQGEDPGLYMTTIDGQYNAQLAQGVYHNICIAGGYVFYQNFQADFPMFMAPIGSASVTTFDAAKEAAYKNMRKK